MEVQVKKEHYDFSNYLDKKRWASYYCQLKETFELNPGRLLVIGVGDDIVTFILRKQGINTETVDFDSNLSPTYTLDVREIDKIPAIYDVIMCCQVLEHIPYEYFLPTIDKIMAKTKTLILSLPIQHNRALSLFKLQRILFKKIKYSVPRYSKVHQFNGEHYWELGTKGYLKSKILSLLNEKYIVKSNYTVVDNCDHHFFIIQNRN